MSKDNKSQPTAISVIIPAHNESAYIAACLDAVLAQTRVQAPLQVIVSANACSDDTADISNGYVPRFAQSDVNLQVVETDEPGKPVALNAADAVATGSIRIYLDADVLIGPQLIAQLYGALNVSTPLYASGKLQVAKPKSWITRRYAALWKNLPFMKSPAVGAGLFAVNEAGRARWGEFPAIISDDTFVRLQFEPHERVEVDEIYIWPMVEGWSNLVSVRRRQDAGVKEIDTLYPGILDREAKEKPNYSQLFAKQPLDFICYCAISLHVKLKQSNDWSRGR